MDTEDRWRSAKSILSSDLGMPEQMSRQILIRRYQTRSGEEGLKTPQKPLSRPRPKSQRELACLKALTSIPFRTVNLWMRTRNWHTFRWKLTLDCHSGKSGNRLAKSRNINAHGTLGPHAWLEKETLQPMEKSTRAWAYSLEHPLVFALNCWMVGPLKSVGKGIVSVKISEVLEYFVWIREKRYGLTRFREHESTNSDSKFPSRSVWQMWQPWRPRQTLVLPRILVVGTQEQAPAWDGIKSREGSSGRDSSGTSNPSWIRLAKVVIIWHCKQIASEIRWWSSWNLWLKPWKANSLAALSACELP